VSSPLFKKTRMKCYEGNFIGVRGYCGSVEPESGLYINDLPGISIKRAAGATEEAYSKGVDFMYAQEAIAFDLTIQDFKQALMRDFTLNSVIDETFFKMKTKTMNFENRSGVLTIYKCINDPFAALRINYVEVYSEFSVTGFIVTINDGITQTEKTFNLVPGLNRLFLHYTSQSDQITVSHPEESLHYTRECFYRCECSTISVNNQSSFNYQASLVCDLDILGCMFRNELKYAMWYRQGILIVENYQSSDRINPSIFAAKMDSANLLLKWWGGMDPKTGFEIKGEYWRHLNSAAQQIKKVLLSSKSLCINCNRLTQTITLP